MATNLTLLAIIRLFLEGIALVCALLLLVGPVGAVYSGIIEGTRNVAPGARRSWKKTIIFTVIGALGLIGLVLTLLFWVVSSFLFGTGVPV